MLDPNAPLGQLKRIDDGVFHLGKDGVMRSYHGNGTCAGYVKLDASQIQRFLDHNGRTDELTKIFEGVNGHDVTDQEQLMKPANWLASLSKRDAEGKLALTITIRPSIYPFHHPHQEII